MNSLKYCKMQIATSVFRALTLTILLLSTVGCGMAEDISNACGGSMDQLCDIVFGRDGDRIDQVEDRVSDLERKYDSLVTLIDHNVKHINNLKENVELLPLLQSQVDVFIVDLYNIKQLLDSVEGAPFIVELIDPCGDGPGYDEVLLKTNTGTLIAYFEDKGKRFLTQLEDGEFYRTTDKQGCNFKIQNGEVIQ